MADKRVWLVEVGEDKDELIAERIGNPDMVSIETEGIIQIVGDDNLVKVKELAGDDFMIVGGSFENGEGYFRVVANDDYYYEIETENENGELETIEIPVNQYNDFIKEKVGVDIDALLK